MQSLYSLSLNEAIKFDDNYLQEKLPKIIMKDIDERKSLERKVNTLIEELIEDYKIIHSVVDERIIDMDMLLHSKNKNELDKNWGVIIANENIPDIIWDATHDFYKNIYKLMCIQFEIGFKNVDKIKAAIWEAKIIIIENACVNLLVAKQY